MKYLFLIRHAKSSWDNMSLADFDRPLNNRGKNDAPLMASIFSELGYKPSIIISSPANRALTTAKVFANKLAIDEADIELNSDLYHASANKIKDIVSMTDKEHSVILVFGHNPGMTYVIDDMCSYSLDNLPTTGIFGIQWKINDWSEILHVKGSKLLYEFPKKYK